MARALELSGHADSLEEIKKISESVTEKTGLIPELDDKNGYIEAEREALKALYPEADVVKAQDFALKFARKETDRATFQAMEALIHNLNTMHSRAGAQIPFSSLNYGLDTSKEGRLVMKNILLATDKGLGNGETPIFPIQIFKIKEGVNYNEGDQIGRAHD